MRRRHWLAAAVAGVAGVLMGCGQPAEDRPDARVLFERTLPTLDGQSRAMSTYAGKPLLVNFWATWCAPCVKEMPELDTLHAEHPHVAFVGIGIDSPDNLREFVARVPVRYDLYEAQTSGLDIMRGLGSRSGGLPYTVLIDADGRIMQTFSGQISRQMLGPILERMAARG